MSATVVCLMGATATGKTELSLEIAERFDVEIVSVDSAQVFRGMDIGTAKPGAEVRRRVPHHLVDIIEPDEIFSAWDFVEQTRRLIEEIRARGRIPLLAGGTMLYFHAFENGLNRLPQADASLRRRLAAEALEVYELTGGPLSRLQQAEADGYRGGIEKIILAAPDRTALHRRIEQRFKQMLEQGLIDEVAALRARGNLDTSMPSMRCVGYRQVWQYLDGESDREQMTERAVAATRQLAKRQITWLRKQPMDAAFDCLNYRKDDIFRRIGAALSRP